MSVAKVSLGGERMSWRIRLEQEVTSCRGCNLFGRVIPGIDDGCIFDGIPAEYEDNGVDYKKYPSEIRPCPLKVEAPTQEYSFETGV